MPEPTPPNPSDLEEAGEDQAEKEEEEARMKSQSGELRQS